MNRIKVSATDNIKGIVANDLYYLNNNLSMSSRIVINKDIKGNLTSNKVWFPKDNANHPRINDKWFDKYYDSAPACAKRIFKYIMNALPYGTNIIKLDRKVIGCWNTEKPLDKSAISKGLKWLQDNGDDGTRPEVIFKPKDTIVIFNAKGKDKDYYFVNPSVIFNGSYNDLVYDFCKQKGITIDEYENMVNEK